MRRLISFLLLATAAAAPLAAQDRDPQDQRAARGDRAERGDRGGQRGGQGGPGRGGNRPTTAQAPAPQVAPAPLAQAPQQQQQQAGRPGRPAPGQFGQRGGAAPQRDSRNDPRGNDRTDRRYDPRQSEGERNGHAIRPSDGPGREAYGTRPGGDRGNGSAVRPGNDPRNGYAGRPGDWRDERGRPNGTYGNARDRGYGNDAYRDQARLGWSGQWRNDRRYDWQGYRSANRNLFRAPRYYGPRGYDYSRWSRGYRVQPFFYGRDYWISDPWRYRLPPAEGYYRWVRYYDDVALIDLRTGLIEDIIYSFFYR